MLQDTVPILTSNEFAYSKQSLPANEDDPTFTQKK